MRDEIMTSEVEEDFEHEDVFESDFFEDDSEPEDLNDVMLDTDDPDLDYASVESGSFDELQEAPW